jgi:uncharacterized membrane protein YsdA (DUF1294 family)/cold shock CspA family protein
MEWNDERGFGFVVPNGGGDRAFIHISELKARSRRPIIGDMVTYSVAKDPRGRLQAKAVGFVEVKRVTHPQGSSLPRSAIGVVALAVVVAAYLAGLLPPILAVLYFVLSGLSFLAYANDKGAARRNAWRTPEHSLHMLDLLGGWPGGLIAQQRFHHKTIKQPFQFVFWLSVIANIGGAWWLTTSGVAARLSASIVG